MAAKAKKSAKSARQTRAESLAAQAKLSLRRPIVVEFAGVPKAGKSSTLSSVQMFLKRCGFRTDVVVERASICPIRDKKHAHFNIWTACTTLSAVLEKTQEPPAQDDPEILFLDRGIFDAICWLRVMERLCRILSTDRETLERFLTMGQWTSRITGVVLMTADPADSLQREKGLLAVVGKPGSIMNEPVLTQLRSIYDEAAKSLSARFTIIRIDTSDPALGNPTASAEAVLDAVLDLIERELEEKILAIPTLAVDRAFGSARAVGEVDAKGLADEFSARGIYGPRRDIEPDTNLVQALPVVVVRNSSGQVLLLLRKEARVANPLHQKLVIWAGGHVRVEDVGKSPLEACAVRELEEELRLSIEEGGLTLLGAVYDRTRERSARHVALVYEWRAPTDDVAIALSADEFFERHGTSLSGKFVSLDDLRKLVDSGELDEPWSVLIAQFLFSKEGMPGKGGLF